MYLNHKRSPRIEVESAKISISFKIPLTFFISVLLGLSGGYNFCSFIDDRCCGFELYVKLFCFRNSVSMYHGKLP